jgi:hypothetical protein
MDSQQDTTLAYADDLSLDELNDADLVDDFVAQNRRLRELLDKTDKTSNYDVYIRQSDEGAEGQNENYRLEQEALPALLAECGIPSDKISRHNLDVNLSGALSLNQRADLKQVYDNIRDGKTKTVFCAAIDRLFRDKSLKFSTDFAAQASLNRVKILTTQNDRFVLLDMRVQNDYDAFLDACKLGGIERDNMRQRLVKARVGAIRDSLGWSGAPFFLGYAVKPKERQADGSWSHTRMYIYEPHAEIVRHIYQLSLRPDILSWAALMDAVRSEGIAVPPFEEPMRSACARKSVCWQTGTSVNAPHELTRKNLITMISYAIGDYLGDRLFGSGRKSGRDHLNRIRKIEREDGVDLDSKVRDYRVYIGNSQELAIFKADNDDDMALVRAVADKWLSYDLFAIRLAQYKTHPRNWAKNPKQTAAIPNTGKSHSTVRNKPWAGYLRCYKHGLDDAGEWNLDHVLGGQLEGWRCHKEMIAGKRTGLCTSITSGSKNVHALAGVLTRCLLDCVQSWLRLNVRFLGTESEQVQANARKLQSLEVRLKQAKADYNKGLKLYEDLTERLGDVDAKEQLDAIFNNRVKPAVEAIGGIQREINLYRQIADKVAADELTEASISTKLDAMILEGEGIAPDRLRSVIDLFVDHVGVYVPEGSRDVWFEMVFKSGYRYVGLTWQGLVNDCRPWTTEEDRALSQLWNGRSGTTFADIQAALLPDRRFNAIYRRVLDLHLADGSRSSKWQKDARDSERQITDLYPDIDHIRWMTNSLVCLAFCDEEVEYVPIDRFGYPLLGVNHGSNFEKYTQFERLLEPARVEAEVTSSLFRLTNDIAGASLLPALRRASSARAPTATGAPACSCRFREGRPAGYCDRQLLRLRGRV